MTIPKITGAKEALSAALEALWLGTTGMKITDPAFIVAESGAMRFGSAASISPFSHVTEDLSDPLVCAGLRLNPATIEDIENDAAYVLQQAAEDQQKREDREDNARMDRADEAYGGYE